MKALLPIILTALAALAQGATAQPAPIDLSPVPLRASPVQLPAHWHHGAFMEIFVRAYQDSDGDGIGDLRGLTSRLPHLQALGVKGLWLMPIQRNADGDHGYATTDFRAIAPEYGTLEDFDTLVREAARRGIGVIIDYVVNHAAAEHPLFVHARSDARSPWRRWFMFAPDAPADLADWFIWDKNPWYRNEPAMWAYRGDVKALPALDRDAKDLYFGTFGPHMPDFDMRNPAVVDYHLASLRFWLNRGLAGLRLDAVPHLVENSGKDWNDQPESRALTRRIVREIHRYPNRYVVCEATAKPQDYGDPALCGGAFAFGYAHHFTDAALGKAASVRALADYYRRALPTMATFVSNHDKFAGPRLWDRVGGDAARYRLAAAGYLLQPGTPFIYYGEEIGQAGIASDDGDAAIRAPMSWEPDAARGGFTRGTPFRAVAPNAATHNARTQRAERGSIFHFYRAMLTLRNTRASIARGSFEHAFADGLVLGFQRRLGRERTLVLINYGTQPARVVAPGIERATPRRLFPARASSVLRARPFDLPAQSVQVFDLRPSRRATPSSRPPP